MKIDKVIFSVDDNPLYSDFWPIQAKLVRKILNAEPILFYLTDEESDFYNDGNGIVKKVNKNNCPDIISSFQTQIIRMWGTKYFEDEICLTADIDMLMINKKYFIDKIRDIPEDDLVIFDSKAYDLNRVECQDESLHSHERFPICYIAAKGKTFNKILNTNRKFENYVYELQKFELGWATDEVYFARCIKNSEHGVNIQKFERDYKSPWIADRRINRHNFPTNLTNENEIFLQEKEGVYKTEFLVEGYYIDAHCPRPYSEHKESIDDLIRLITTDDESMNFLGKKHGTDKVLHHRYDRIYPIFLDKLRNKRITLFEIGCGSDYASFKMWIDYFPHGKIFCMDIHEETETERGKVFKGDQTKIEDLISMVDKIGLCDVIIDDGSHIAEHQINTFNFLFEKMLKNGGTYIIEDIECSYWNPKEKLYGYNVGNFNVVDYFSSLPNKINYEFSSNKNHQNISSITFFKNCIIIEKMTDEEIKEKEVEYRFKEFL